MSFVHNRSEGHYDPLDLVSQDDFDILALRFKYVPQKTLGSQPESPSGTKRVDKELILEVLNGKVAWD